jgi:hypothetical protein
MQFNLVYVEKHGYFKFHQAYWNKNNAYKSII